LSFFSLLLHEFRAKHLLRLVLIVTPTTQSDALDGCLAALGDWIDVIEFQEPPGSAAPTVLAHERALAAIALPHGAPNVGRNGPRRCAPGSRRTRRKGRGKLLFLQILHQGLEAQQEHLTDRRRGMAVT
jgi:hypothetical protein